METGTTRHSLAWQVARWENPRYVFSIGKSWINLKEETISEASDYES